MLRHLVFSWDFYWKISILSPPEENVDEMEKFVISVNGFFLVGIIVGGLRAEKLKQGGE